MAEDEEGDGTVFARAIPRRINPWIFATIASEFLSGICHVGEVTFDNLTTVFSQQFNWAQDREVILEQASLEIETLTSGAYDASSGEARGD